MPAAVARHRRAGDSGGCYPLLMHRPPAATGGGAWSVPASAVQCYLAAWLTQAWLAVTGLQACNLGCRAASEWKGGNVELPTLLGCIAPEGWHGT